MSKHRKALSSIIDDLSVKHPGCGILVSGSVQRGEETPHSDIDLFVVFEGTGEIRLDRETAPDGLYVDIARFPEKGFRDQVAGQWYKFWMFSRAEIIHDPAGIARRNQTLARGYFRNHPDIDCAWEEQLTEVRRHKADRTYALRYPTWDDFAGHIERLVEKKSVTQ